MGTPADPVGWFMAATAVASAATGAYGAVAQGQAEGASYERSAQGAEQEARLAGIQAGQAAADVEKDWSDAFGAYAAVRASKGLSPDSPTARALERGLARDARQLKSRQVLGFRLREGASYFEAASARKAGKSARRAGYIAAIPSLLDLAAQGRRLGGGGSGGGLTQIKKGGGY